MSHCHSVIVTYVLVFSMSQSRVSDYEKTHMVVISLASVDGHFSPGAAAAPQPSLRVLLLALRHEAEPVEEGVGGGHVLTVGGAGLTLRQNITVKSVSPPLPRPYLLLTDKPPDETGKPGE